MAAKTDPINTSNPVGTSDPKQGDNYIRALARALIEFLGVDHYVGAANPWGSDASGDETGEHKKVTFHEAISDPTVASGDGCLYIKGDPPQLYFRDEDDGNVIQLTSGGDVLFSSLSHMPHDTYLSGTDVAGTGNIGLIKAGTGDVPVIGTGAELSTSGDPTEAAGIACKEWVEGEVTDQLAASLGAAMAGGFATLTTSTASFSKTITFPNGLILHFGYDKDPADFAIDISGAGFTAVYMPWGFGYDLNQTTASRSLYVYALTTSTLTFGGAVAVGEYDGIFYVVLGR